MRGGEGGFPARPGVAGPVRGRVPGRVPVSRQITMMEAGASMPLSRPNPSRATDPAITAAPTAIPASAPSQPRVSHDSIPAVRASRSHPAVVGPGTVTARAAPRAAHRSAATGGLWLVQEGDHDVRMCSSAV